MPHTDGYLRSLVVDDFKNKTSEKQYFLQKDDGSTVSLHVSNGKIKTKPGSRIRVPEVSKTVAGFVVGNESSIQVLADPIQSATAVTGTKKIAVIHANFSNLSVISPTIAQTKNIFDTQITPYFTEMSYGNATFVADVYGYVNMNIPKTCDIDTYSQATITAADAQINYNNYQYVMIIFPNNGCIYGGYAYFGPMDYQTNEGYLPLSVSAMVNTAVLSTGKALAVHEIGHNLGLEHANGWECGVSSLGSNCTSTIYGDRFDVMGKAVYQSHYGAHSKEFLQWLSPSNIQTVTQSGTYTVNRIETYSTGVQSLKIPMEGASKYYSIENRTNYGFDASLPTNAVSGALIKIVENGFNTYTTEVTNIIDSTPNSKTSDDFNDSGFTLNKTLTDSDRGLRITPVSKINGILTVNVTFYPPTIVSPVAGASLTDTSGITFDWNDIPIHLGYTIQVSRNLEFIDLLLNIPVSESQITASGLPRGVNLYWRVRANYSFGSSDWSSGSVFSVLPDAPALITPPLTTNGSTISTLRPTFTWVAVEGATFYEIWISNDATFGCFRRFCVSQPIVKVVGSPIVNSYMQLYDLPYNTMIHWKVRAKSPVGDGTWSTVYSFKTPISP